MRGSRMYSYQGFFEKYDFCVVSKKINFSKYSKDELFLLLYRSRMLLLSTLYNLFETFNHVYIDFFKMK